MNIDKTENKIHFTSSYQCSINQSQQLLGSYKKLTTAAYVLPGIVAEVF